MPGVEYRSPRKFSWRERMILFLVPPLVAFLLKLLMWTCRIRQVQPDNLAGALAAHKVILVFWHEHLAMAAFFFRGRNYHTLTSFSYDGELAARVVSHFGSEAVRGSSSSGGAEGLRNLERALAQVPAIGITPDGPKGPRRVGKPGMAVLAARSNAVAVPVAFAADCAWRLRSWDRFQIPKPFSRVTVAFGEPVVAPADEMPENVEVVRAEIEARLNALLDGIEAKPDSEAQAAAPR